MHLIDVVLAVAGLLIAASCAVLIRNAIRRRQAVGALTPEQRGHYDALRAARKQLGAAEREHNAGVRGIERQISTTQKAAKLDNVGGHVLYDDRIQTPEGTHPLGPAVTAMVDTAGNLATKSRSTLTRMGVGTLVAGPFGLVAGAVAKKSSKVDTRELYLLVDGGDWASMAQLNPDHGTQARRFAQAVNVAARQAESVTRNRAAEVARLQKQLQRTRSDRGAIDEASRLVTQLEATAPPAVAELLVDAPAAGQLALQS